MKTTDKYLGLDVHKDTITVAIAEGVRLGEVRPYRKISNDVHSLEKLLPRLGGEKARLHFVYLVRRILTAAGAVVPDKEAYWFGFHLERFVKHVRKAGEL